MFSHLTKTLKKSQTELEKKNIRQQIMTKPRWGHGSSRKGRGGSHLSLIGSVLSKGAFDLTGRSGDQTTGVQTGICLLTDHPSPFLPRQRSLFCLTACPQALLHTLTPPRTEHTVTKTPLLDIIGF